MLVMRRNSAQNRGGRGELCLLSCGSIRLHHYERIDGRATPPMEPAVRKETDEIHLGKGAIEGYLLAKLSRNIEAINSGRENGP